MPAKLLNGKKLANKILLQVKKKVDKMKIKPGLAAILIGSDKASKLYLKLKEKACEKTGIIFSNYIFDKDCKEEKILEVINFLNKDEQINGIIVQLPLPKKFNTNKIIAAIKSQKDIDGFHPNSRFISPTALGIIELLKETKVNLKNKRVTILSNSKIFAKPFYKLLLNSKIKYLNPKSKNLNLKDTDVAIVAIGKPYFIKLNMLKKNSILIDVGINRIRGKTVGDIDPSCDKVAAWRSPVPGGVGPMTVAMLLQNLIKK